MFKKGEVDHALVVAALVAVVALGGLVWSFSGADNVGAANIILPRVAPTYIEPQFQAPQLIGDRVGIQSAPPNEVSVRGQQAAYDSYTWCRQAENWETQKEQSQCCNVRCATECGKYFGDDGYARDYVAQDKYSTCKQTWCEDSCRRYMWEEISQ